MKSLRKLGAAVVLTLVLALSAFAGEIQTPPCAPPEGGQIPTPPCAAAFGDMDTPTGGEMATPTLASSETSFTEIAADVLLIILPLF